MKEAWRGNIREGRSKARVLDKNLWETSNSRYECYKLLVHPQPIILDFVEHNFTFHIKVFSVYDCCMGYISFFFLFFFSFVISDHGFY